MLEQNPGYQKCHQNATGNHQLHQNTVNSLCFDHMYTSRRKYSTCRHLVVVAKHCEFMLFWQLGDFLCTKRHHVGDPKSHPNTRQHVEIRDVLSYADVACGRQLARVSLRPIMKTL